MSYATISIKFSDTNIISFTKDEIISAQVVEEANAAGTDLQISTLEFTVISTNENFSMFNGELYAKLKRKLPVTIYGYIDSVEYFIGKYYLDKWQAKANNQMEFTALNIIGVLAEYDFDGIFWETPVTVAAAMAEIFDPIATEYSVDSSIATKTISGWIAPGKYRDALQQICIACGAVATTVRQNDLSIAPYRFPSTASDHVFALKNSRQDLLGVQTQVAKIELVSHNYTQSGEIETIFDSDLGAGNHKIVFQTPYYGIVVSGAGYVQKVLATEGGDYLSTEGGDYIEGGGEFTFGSNSVYIYLDTPSHVTITGYKWIDGKKSYTFTETGYVQSGDQKILTIANATLINTDRADDVLSRLVDFFRLRYTQEVLTFDFGAAAGDIAFSKDLNDEYTLSTLQRTVIDISGGFLTKAYAVGKVPIYVEDAESPVRVGRSGIAVSGRDLMTNNLWRRYA